MSSLHLPPGLSGIGFSPFDRESPEGQVHARWNKTMEIAGYDCFSDPDFVRAFIASVPLPEEQEKYVAHTLHFLRGGASIDAMNRETDIDPQYVLLFRRSLPSETGKPERHWTTDYTTALRGLRYEIPGVHRLHSVILCSTLADVLSGGKRGFNKAESEGEIKIENDRYDQGRCICIFRPKKQQEELDAYLQQTNALTLEHITEQLRQKFRNELKK